MICVKPTSQFQKNIKTMSDIILWFNNIPYKHTHHKLMSSLEISYINHCLTLYTFQKPYLDLFQNFPPPNSLSIEFNKSAKLLSLILQILQFACTSITKELIIFHCNFFFFFRNVINKILKIRKRYLNAIYGVYLKLLRYWHIYCI